MMPVAGDAARPTPSGGQRREQPLLGGGVGVRPLVALVETAGRAMIRQTTDPMSERCATSACDWIDELTRVVADDERAAAARRRPRDRRHPGRHRRTGGRRHLPPAGRRRRGALRRRRRPSPSTSAWSRLGHRGRRRHRRAQRPGGVRQRAHPPVRRPAAAARLAARVRRPRRRVHRRPRAHRVRLRRSTDARAARGPGPRRAADRRVRRHACCERFLPLTFTALKTAIPAPDDAYGQPLAGASAGAASTCCSTFEPVTFVVHLMQGGRLLVDEKQSAKPRGGQARFVFDGERRRRCCSPSRAPSAGPACGACRPATR